MANVSWVDRMRKRLAVRKRLMGIASSKSEKVRNVELSVYCYKCKQVIMFGKARHLFQAVDEHTFMHPLFVSYKKKEVNGDSR